MYGIDISSWQKNLKLKNTGAEFVIVKATDGCRFVDPNCDKFIQQSKGLGKLWGFYHFANGVHKSSMKAQARYFVKHCKNYFGQGIPVLDWENSDEKYGGAVLKYGPKAAKEFLDEVYRLTGIRCMVYTSASVTTSYDWSNVAKDYLLWGAGYTGKGTYKLPGTNRYKWGSFGYPKIHQYSSSGGLDKNIAYISPKEWKSIATGTFINGKHAFDGNKSKKYAAIAKEVISGKWGNGSERKIKLEKAGYDYNKVQKEVNNLFKRKSIGQIAKEVISGKWGNGSERKIKLEKAGYDYNEVQKKVNNILK